MIVMTITMYKGDLPKNLDFGDSVAIDTETLGLIPERDPLCLIQLSSVMGQLIYYNLIEVIMMHLI